MTDEADTLTADDLRQFIGSEQLFRHGLNRRILYTEGVQYLAQRAGAYWLLDAIAIAQAHVPAVAAEEFQLWTLTVAHDQSAQLACDNGNGHIVYRQAIPFTDFPLPSITLYCTNNTILLPSEY